MSIIRGQSMQIESVCIVGGGSSGWMSAAIFSKTFPDMQIALALMFVASILLYALLVSIKARTEVLIREQNSRWVEEEVRSLMS